MNKRDKGTGVKRISNIEQGMLNAEVLKTKKNELATD